MANFTGVSPKFTNQIIDRRLRKEKQKGIFDAAESNLVDGITNEEGNFHVRE